MRIYAHPDDLVPDWIGEVPEWMDTDPRRASKLIRSASQLVTKATRLARYDVTPDGYPTSQEHVDAFRDAVCQQVAIWHGSDVDPDKGVGGQVAKVSSQSAGGGSVSYTGTQTTQELGRIATTLCDQSWMILDEANLISNEVTLRR